MHKNYYKWLDNWTTISHHLGEIRTFKVIKTLLLLAGETCQQGLSWQCVCIKKAEHFLRGELRLPAAHQGLPTVVHSSRPAGALRLDQCRDLRGIQEVESAGLSDGLGAEGGGRSTVRGDPTCIPAWPILRLVALPAGGPSSETGQVHGVGGGEIPGHGDKKLWCFNILSLKCFWDMRMDVIGKDAYRTSYLIMKRIK